MLVKCKLTGLFDITWSLNCANVTRLAERGAAGGEGARADAAAASARRARGAAPHAPSKAVRAGV